MTVKSVVPDHEAQTLTVTAEYSASVDQVWQLWADPRKLERWWGPPTYPATVQDHDLSVGGQVTYFMTGPEGDKHGGYWRILAVEAPTGLEFEDGFGDPSAPATGMPITHTRVTISDAGSGVTQMLLESNFPSAEAMDQLLTMGMQEGLTSALGQIDALLSESTS
jgi:uncharacterized protein YndB with AHSA1/START domain